MQSVSIIIIQNKKYKSEYEKSLKLLRGIEKNIETINRKGYNLKFNILKSINDRVKTTLQKNNIRGLPCVYISRNDNYSTINEGIGRLLMPNLILNRKKQVHFADQHQQYNIPRNNKMKENDMQNGMNGNNMYINSAAAQLQQIEDMSYQNYAMQFANMESDDMSRENEEKQFNEDVTKRMESSRQHREQYKSQNRRHNKKSHANTSDQHSDRYDPVSDNQDEEIGKFNPFSTDNMSDDTFMQDNIDEYFAQMAVRANGK